MNSKNAPLTSEVGDAIRILVNGKLMSTYLVDMKKTREDVFELIKCEVIDGKWRFTQKYTKCGYQNRKQGSVAPDR